MPFDYAAQPFGKLRGVAPLRERTANFKVAVSSYVKKQRDTELE